MNNTKNIIVAVLFAFAFAILGAGQALANVTVTAATGGGSISADTAADAPSPGWTSLGTINIAEAIAADFGVGTGVTLILKAPAGFEFNTAVTPSISFVASRNITSAAVAMTDSSTITITLTVTGTGSLDTLTIGSTTGLQVRPTAGAPLATGKHIYRPSTGGGNATIAGITANADGSGGSNFGNLTEVAGTVTQLAFTTMPAGATAGAAFTTQPVVKSLDQFGNSATNGLPANSFVAVSLTGGTGPLQGTTSVNLGMSAGKGTATYSGLRIDVAGSDKQLTATSTNGLTSALSSAFTVIPAVASKLVMATQPSATATAGVAFDQQPAVWIQDAFNNLRTSDTLTVTATRNAGAGSLLGTTNIVAVGGVATYTDLAHTLPTNITIRFTSGALAAATSGVVAVSAGALSQLLVVLPGETYAPGTVTGKTGTPTAQTAGTPFTVRVIAADAGYNTVTNVTDTVAITSSDATATLPASAALINGTNSFTVTCRDAGSQTVTASDTTDGITTGTSSAVTVNPGTFTKLQLLMPGETAAPGTPTGKTGTPDAQTAGTAFTITVNSVDANWNLVSSTHALAITTTDPNDVHPASAALSAGTRTFIVTFRTVGSWTVTVTDTSDGTKTPCTSPSTTVNVGAFAKLQLLVPGEVASPGSTTGKTGTPSAQNIDTPFMVTVNAVDANWNLVNTVSDTVGITSSDPTAALSPEAALVNGTQTFAMKFNTAGSRTVTASDITDPSKTANTSPAITVAVGAFAKLQVIMPGETAAPGTTLGKTGTPTVQTAGTAFSATVRSVDASWNLVSTTHTVHITSSDAQAVLPANAALSAGSGSFSVTFRTTASQTVTASDVTTNDPLDSDTGTATTVNPAVASKLVIATQPSATATAGVLFVQQPVIYIEDAYNNVRSNDTLVVRATRSAGAGILQGTTNVTAVGGIATYTDLAHPYATNITIQFTSGALTAATSTTVAVSPAAYSQLQVLLPGETAAPATATGHTGTPTAQIAGTAVAVRVGAVDAYWNLVNTGTNTVGITSSDATALLPADADLINGTNSFSVTFRDAGNQTVTASDLTDGITAGTSSPVTVNGGAVTKLQLLLPGETAAPGTTSGKTGAPTAETTGTAFSVTVNAVDANWNVVSSTHTVGINSTDPNDVVQANAALVAGTRTFTITNRTAGSWTITATDVTTPVLTPNTSPSYTVNVGAFTKLQLLVPGEAASPGSTTGKTGTPSAQNIDTPFMVTVNAVDANWNLVNTVSDTVGITSSDPTAALSPEAALVNGTQTFAMKFNTAGSRTVTASDITDPSKTANTSPAITVAVGAFAKLQVIMPGETAAPGTTLGKTGTPTVQTAGTAFSATVRSVDASWNLVSTTHTVHITSSDAQAVLPANAALSAGSGSFSVTFRTTASQTVTASDVTTNDPLDSDTGTATTVNPAVASKLVIATQPSATATAGVLFVQQPVIYIEDAYNNVRSNDTLVVRATRSAGAGILQGTTNVTAVGGIATYTDLAHPYATNITIQFTSGALTAATSTTVAVSPAAYSQLQVLLPGETAAPATATGHTGTPTAQIAGTAVAVRVSAVDAYWNVVNTQTNLMGITSSDLTAILPANAALINGTNSFSVTFEDAGNQTVTASDLTDGITTGTSSSIMINAGAVTKLQLLLPGETAAPGTPTGKTGTPTAQTAGTAFTVTVNSVDVDWNVASSTHTVGINSTDPNDVVQANAALVAGTRTFTITNRTAGSWTITATDVTTPVLTPNTSPSYTVNVGAFTKLQLLVPGEAASPGSTTGKTGTPSAQNIDTPFMVTVNAVDANWNLVNTVSDTVGITSSDPTAALSPEAALVNGTQTFAMKFNTAGSRTVTASDITDPSKTANTSPAITVAVGAFAKLQVIMPGETAAPGTTLGKTGTPTVQTAGTAFSATVRSVDASWNLVSTTHTVHITSSDAQAVLPANAALSAGSGSFSVTFRTTASQTVTASDVTTNDPLDSDTGTATTVNPAVASKLVIATQPSATATAGVLFVQQPVIYIEDAYNNVRSNDTLVVRATRSAGAGILQGTTNVTAVGGIATYTDLAHPYATNITIQFTSGALTAATSTTVAVSPAAYSQLQVLLPGETAAPATATGHTGTPTAQIAGTAVAVRVSAVDAYWNLINTETNTVGITSSDLNAILPGNADLINGTNSFSVTFQDAGSQTVTASDLTDGITTGTSSAVTVNAGAVTKLQLLLPGETAAPGTPTGKTGTPSAQTAGTAFIVTVNAVDANWNVASSTHTVGINSTDPNDVLQANAALVAGTRSFTITNRTAGSWTITATDTTAPVLTANTSPSYTVNVGAFAKLQLLMPGETAAAGSTTGKTGTPTAQNTDTPFSVTVNAVDTNWNLVSTNDTVGITCSDANAALPGSAALSSGTQTFSVKFNTAGSRTVTATDLSDGTKTANTGTATAVAVGAFAQLQILLPGETAAAGTTTGKTGSPTTRIAGTAFNVTVNAVDASHNIVSTNDLVHLTSTDANATLAANTAMASGTVSLSVTLKTVGSWTVTASDATHAGIAADTSTAVTANVGAVTKLQLLVPGETAAPGSASGKTGTPSTETAGTGYSVTVNAVDANWNVASSTHTIRITTTDANDVLPANAALVAGTQTFTITNLTAGSWTVTATDTAGTPLSPNTSPSIAVAAGAFTKLQLLMPGELVAAGTIAGKTGTPSARTAGTAFNVTVNGVDDNWNVVTTVTDTIGITCTDTNATLPSNAALAAGAGTFSVTLLTAGTATVTATDITDGTKAANTSPSTTVNTGTVAKLQLLLPGEAAAPGTSSGKTGTPDAQMAGAAFTVTVRSVDANWNLVSSTHVVGIDSTDANDVRQANTALSAGSRVFTITNRTAGTWTITATDTTAPVLSPNTSPAYTVNVGAFVKLQLLMPGETAAAGTASGRTGTPTAQNTDNPVTVTVNAVDANWNLVNTASDTVGITSSDANAVLPSSAALSGGTQTFSVKFNTSGSRTVTATDLTDGTKTANTGTATTVTAGAFARLQILLPGETAVAGTTTGKTGSPTARTAGTAFNVTVNAVDASYNVVSTNDLVHLTSTDANATLAANTAMAGGTVALSVTLRTVGSWTVTASDATHALIGADTSAAVTANVGAFARLQLVVPGETAAPGSASGKTGTPSEQTVATAFTVTVRSVDANWNLINTNDIVHIASSDTSAVLPANAALSGGSQTFSVTLMTAGSRTVTGSDVTHTGIASGPSSAITVNKGDQTITFGALANKNYGDPSFGISATASSGLAASYAIVSGPAAVVGSTVTITGAGTVTVRASQAGNANWNAATNVDQSFDVAQAALVAGAADKTRAYGALNPEFTVNYFGFVNGDTSNVISGNAVLTTLAETNSPLGAYAIEITAGTLSNANYSFTFTNGTLTVTPAILSVTAENQTRPYGDANPELTYTYSGFVNGQDTNILSGAPDISTTADTASPATTYPIMVTQGTLSVSDTNYTLAFVNGTLTVTPLALTVTADPQTKVYGEIDPALTYKLTSGALIHGDTLSGSLVRSEGDSVGAHAIQQGSLTAGTNYALTFVSADLTITARPITVTASSRSKTYGQEVTFDGTEFTASGLAPGETVTSVTLNSSGAASTAAVSGSPYAIVPSNAAGIEPANYDISYVNGSLTVGRAPLTVNGITADNKPYDGNTTATIHPDSATLQGQVSGDDVTLNITAATGAFADAAMGTGKTVYITGLTLDGTSAGNYSLTQPTTTADIIGGGLTVAGIEASSKAYDGTTNATLILTNAILVGVAGGDDVSLDTTNAVGAFEDKNIGTAKTVTITGLALFGADAGKYTLTQPTTNADITAVALTVTGLTANSKPYDGNSAATLGGTAALSAGVVGSEDVTLAGTATATFDTKNVGTVKPVTVGGYTLAGADIGNYTLSQPAGLTADITPIALSVTGVTANSKPYDGNSTATLGGSAALSAGVVGSEDVTLGGTPVAAFDNKNVGTAKPVTVNGYALVGADIGNYTLSQPAGLAADISPIALSVTGVAANSKPYDGNTTATLGGTAALSAGVVGSEDVTLGGMPVAAFDTKNVGTAKPVTVSGYALAGADIGNYTLSQPAGLAADISPIALSVTGVTANSKPYDGNSTATLTGTAALSAGVVGSEDVTLDGTPVAAFDNQNVGTAKPVTVSGYTLAGADIGNYTLSQPAGLSADIAPASSATSLVSAQNPSAQGSNVTFTATVSSGTGTPTGEVVFKANTVPFSTNSLVSGIASASTTALAVGTNTVTAEYAAQGNYLGSTNSLEQVVTSANIETPRTLGIQDNGDGTVTVSFSGTPGAEYLVQAVTDLGAPSWQNVSTNTAGVDGQWTFTDSTAGQRVRFYRSAKP